MELSDWFKGFEKGIAKLTAEQREQFFSECGKHCYSAERFRFIKSCMKRRMETWTFFFSEANELPGVRCETIEKGSAYDLYFIECTCGLHKQGYVSTPLLCECSRQSILYVLHSLWKNRKFNVSICGSILHGNPDCKMRIETEEILKRAIE